MISNAREVMEERGETYSRRFKAGCLVLIFWGVVEALAYLTLCLRGEALFSFRVNDHQRTAVLAELTNSQARPAQPDYLNTQRLHPYLGAAHWNWETVVEKIPTPQPDRQVVGLFGGSVALQTGQAPFLQSYLEELTGRQVTVVNLAAGGYKQPQQLMGLNYCLVMGKRFDVVICLDGFNEVALHGAENQRAGNHPVAPRLWALRSADSLDSRRLSLAADYELARREAERASRLSGFFLWRYSPTAQLFWRVRVGSLLRHYKQSQLALHNSRASVPIPWRGRPDEVFPTLVDIWAHGSVQMHQLCRANKMAYFHFLQPNQYAPVSKPMSQEEKRIAILPNQPYRPGAERGYPLLMERGRQLKAQGIAFHDLTGLFAKDERIVYKDTCCHFNELGTQLLSEAIAQKVVEGSPELRASTRPARRARASQW